MATALTLPASIPKRRNASPREAPYSSAVRSWSAARRQRGPGTSPSYRPMVMLVLPISIARNMLSATRDESPLPAGQPRVVTPASRPVFPWSRSPPVRGSSGTGRYRGGSRKCRFSPSAVPAVPFHGTPGTGRCPCSAHIPDKIPPLPYLPVRPHRPGTLPGNQRWHCRQKNVLRFPWLILRTGFPHLMHRFPSLR